MAHDLADDSEDADDSASSGAADDAQGYDLMRGPPRAADLAAAAEMLLEAADRLAACGRGQSVDLRCFEQTLPAAVVLSEILASTAMLVEHVLCAYDTPAVQAAYTVIPAQAEDAETLLIISGRLKEYLLDVHHFLAAIRLRPPLGASTRALAPAAHRSVPHELTTLARRGRTAHAR